jgi:cytochrome c oxidase subunit I+III
MTDRPALPNRLPRPKDELRQLEKAWEVPKGWRLLTAVNNTYIGVFYIGAALLFFVLAACWRC